jgi:prolyl-tRNA synthetase
MASGGDFTSKYSHEFQTLCNVGEDNIYIDRITKQAINEEVWNDETRALFPSNTQFEKMSASEVGNIFPLESKFSNAINFQYVDANNKKQPIIMGSYGI